MSGRKPKALQPPAQRKQSRAFTLVELLVVVAIIAILVAWLMPALQQNHRGLVTNVLYLDGRVASLPNDEGRFNVDVMNGGIRDSFSKMLDVFARADEL